MDLTFLYLPQFDTEWNRLGLTDTDLQALENAIRIKLNAPVIRGSGGLRKLRFAPPTRNQGKSGALRIGFAYFQVNNAVVVALIISKKDAATFTTSKLKAVSQMLAVLRKDFQ